MSSLPLYIDLDGFGVDANALTIAGHSIHDVMLESDHRPVYVYSTSLIRRRIEKLRSALPEGIKIHYAIKANPMPELVQYVAGFVDGLDVASGGELAIARQTETVPADISFAGPGKSDAELSHAVHEEIVINIESQNELLRLVKVARAQGRTPKIAIRINPDFELKSSGMRMSGGPKPFGIDAEQVPGVLATLHQYPVEFVGFHIFSGSQNLNAASICEAQTKTLDLALELSKVAPAQPQFINIGGGFGIPYFRGDEPLDLDAIGSHLAQLKVEFTKRLPATDLVVELGRYIVGEAGIYICQVIDRKVSRGKTYLVVNGGLHHHLSASGNFGQVIRKDYPVVIGSRVNGDSLMPFSIVGPLCTPLDIIAASLDAPSETSVGDLVVVFQSGAYGFSASPLGFLGHPPPGQVLL